MKILSSASGWDEPFHVLGSAQEWPGSFFIKPVDLFSVAIRNPEIQQQAIHRVVEDLGCSNDTWVGMRRFLKGALLTTAIFTATASGAWALDQDEAIDPTPVATVGDNSNTMATVNVIGVGDNISPLSTTKYSGPLNEIPQSATVVDQEQMGIQGITTMRDALRDVSGISIAAGEFSQQGDTLTVRGFSINHDIFLDGMRDYGSYYRDPFFLSEVEVLKGPSGLLFGDGTTGGVVNQVSKTPSLTPSIQASLGVGVDDDTRRVTADINEPLTGLGSDVALRLNVVSDQANVSQRNDAQTSLGGIAPVLEFGIGTPTRLTLSYLHEDDNAVPDYGIPWLLNAPAPVPQQNFYGFMDDYLRTSVDLESLKFEHDFSDSFNFSENARYGNYYRDVRITEPQIAATEAVSILQGTLPLSQAVVTPNELSVYSTETSFDSQTDLTGQFKTAGMKHTLKGGVEVAVETSDPTQQIYSNVPTQNLLTPNENLVFNSAGVSVSAQISAGMTDAAAYVLDTIDLDEKWELIGGLRYDYVSAAYSNPVSFQGTLTQTDNLLNWRGGLVFKPRPNSSIYFVAGTSSDPSAENLALSGLTASLAPEQTLTFELGTKWGVLDDKLSLTAATFWDEMDNALEESPTNPALDVDAGTERARGFELGVQGYVTRNWEVMAGYTFLDSEYVNYISTNGNNLTGYSLRNAPQDTVNFWNTYDLSEKFSIGAGLDAVTDRNGGKLALMPNGSYVIEDVPGYITFSGMVKYNLDKNISIQANGTNLGNAYYIDQVHPGHIVPGAGRAVLVSTNFKF